MHEISDAKEKKDCHRYNTLAKDGKVNDEVLWTANNTYSTDLYNQQAKQVNNRQKPANIKNTSSHTSLLVWFKLSLDSGTLIITESEVY